MSSRPYIQAESIHIFESRAFGASIQNFCDAVQKKEKGVERRGASGILNLFLVRPDRDGRRQICAGITSKPGGLFELGMDMADCADGMPMPVPAWHAKVHKVAFAASKKPFEDRGSGEQVFGAPGENSCMALLDDVTTPEPLLAGVAGLSIETSAGNYQHLYACDRVLTGEERRLIQLALVDHSKSLGVGGDAAACGPFQPHRVPGSVNYKQGRGLFVCRLAATWLFHVDGARPLPADKWIRKGQELAAAAPCKTKSVEHAHADATSTGQRPGLRRGRESGGDGGDKSDSGSDWAWTCLQVEHAQAAGKEIGDDLAQRLEQELADRARHRRGKDAERYARLTVFNVRREKQF
jgi:hypothetical protein